MSKKTAALLLAIVLVIGGAIGGTIAWLTDETNELVNTFTVGNVDIDLKETKSDFKMVPGCDIEKDPVVTVVGGSEACWLFVKIDESADLTNYIDWDISTDADGDGAADGTDGWKPLAGENGVYYLKVTASDNDQAFHVLDGDKVTVKTAVTKGMMQDVTDGDAVVKLTFTAYAVQSAKVDTAADAWVIAKS